jgi:integrase
MAIKKFKFVKVHDSNGHNIRGLYKRGNLFYARLTNTDRNSGIKKMQWVPLVKAQNLTSAKEELGKIRALRDNQELEFFKDGPPFSEYVEHYLKTTKVEKNTPGKPAKTWENENSFLRNYLAVFGDKPLNRITAQEIIQHRTKRLEDGVAKGTMRLQVIALRNLYKRAIVEGKSRINPAALVKPLPHKAKEKFLLNQEEINEFAATAKSVLKRNGQQVSDWILLLAFSGARPTEALSLKWSHVDFEKGQISFPAEIVKGCYGPRHVEFNPSLRRHLEDMATRKTDNSWLFPSPRPNRIGGRQETFDAEFRKVRLAISKKRNTESDKQRMLSISPHFLRHFFVSVCCMSGIDVMTTSQWVGHKDSKLVRELYGQLDNAYRKKQADKLSFERPQTG